MSHSSALLFLSLTAAWYVIAAQSATAAGTTDGTTSGPDQVILITPDWRPSSPPDTLKVSGNKSGGQLVSPTLNTPPPAPPAKEIKPAPPVVIKQASVVPVIAPAPIPVWSASTGSTLHKTISAWAAREKYDVIWDAGDLDYPIVSPLTFAGSFEEAITQIFALYEKADRKFKVEGWRPQRLIKITERSQLDAGKGGKSL